MHSPSAYLSKSCALSLATAILVSFDSPCVSTIISQASDRWRQRKRDTEKFLLAFPLTNYVWNIDLHNAQIRRIWKGYRDGEHYLAIDSIDLPILVLQLGSHVESHISQIADHCVHLTHILLHLIFTSIVRYSKTTTSARCIDFPNQMFRRESLTVRCSRLAVRDHCDRPWLFVVGC